MDSLEVVASFVVIRIENSPSTGSLETRESSWEDVLGGDGDCASLRREMISGGLDVSAETGGYSSISP